MKRNPLSILALAAMALGICGCGEPKDDGDPIPPTPHDDTATSAINVGGAVAPKGGGATEGIFFVRDQNDSGLAVFSNEIAIAESQDGVNWQSVIPTIENAGDSAQPGALPVAAAIVMDYSGTMTNGDSIPKMEAAVDSFIDLMSESDTAEIIKFSIKARMLQKFTSDKFALKNAVAADFPDSGFTSSFYDAVQRAVADTAGQSTPRAVVALTDGRDNSSDADQPTVTAEARAQGIPIFTVGLGSRVSEFELMSLAYDTGAFYYGATTSDDLTETYQKISGVLRKAVKGQWSSPFSSGTVQCKVTITYHTPAANYVTERILTYTR